MAEKDKIVEAQAEPKKKPAGARKERKSPRAIYEEIFVNAAKAENEHLSLKNANSIEGLDLLWVLLQEYQQNPEATTKQRSLSLQLLAACLNMMHRSEVNTNLLERLQHQPPNLSLREPGRKYPLGNGGISNEDIALEIVNAHQEDFEAPEQLQRLLIELKKYENFGRLV